METHLDDLGLYDIYGAWHVPWWQTSLFYYSISVMGVIILVSSIFIITRYWLSRKAVVPFWQQAINELEVLAKRPIVTPAQKKECYFIMTHVLKRYVGMRYQLEATHKTDSQFIEYLQKSSISIELVSNIENIFIDRLTIKFANDSVKYEEIQQDLTHAISFIKATMISEVHDTVQ